MNCFLALISELSNRRFVGVPTLGVHRPGNPDQPRLGFQDLLVPNQWIGRVGLTIQSTNGPKLGVIKLEVLDLA